MATPTDRASFKTYCRHALGEPVITLNISDEQVDDRVDEALQYMIDYHYDFTEKIYYKQVITANNIATSSIDLPANVIGAVNIFDISSALGGGASNMFSITYQIALNDLWTFMSSSLVPYYMTMSHLRLMEQILVGTQPIRYNRYNNVLHVDTDWTRFNVGSYLVVEAYSIVDPDTYNKMWGDRFFYKYATQLIKKQWGENMKKFVGMPLPGGIVMNGQQIYNEAVEELEKMEEEMLNSFSLPVTDLIG